MTGATHMARVGEAHRAAPIDFKARLPMLDLAMLAGGLLFFAISVGYAIACDRL